MTDAPPRDPNVIFSMIVAISEDGVIGRNGALPWHLPADLKRFRKLTMGKPIIMGRKTYESIGRSLDGRRNIVLTRDHHYDDPGISVAHSVSEASEIARQDLEQSGREEAYVIGGEAIFRDFAPLCERIYLSKVAGHFAGDAFFPLDLRNGDAWFVETEEAFPADDRNPHSHVFSVLVRKQPVRID